jgi:pimeloyl-ACP methyl ester carboxylesterase
LVDRPRIILLPGVGADYRLLDVQKQLHADVEVPSWIPPLPRESLAGYAERMAERIDPHRPFILGGVSFGGMLAAEMVHHLRPHVHGLLLLATCRSNAGVPWLYRTAWKVARIVPAGLLKRGHLLMPFVRKVFGIASSEHAEVFSQMLRDTDAKFLKWSLSAVMGWPGVSEPIDVPVLHIHGECDWVLPARHGTPDHVITGAGHVMNVSHAEDVNRLIAQWMHSACKMPA